LTCIFYKLYEVLAFIFATRIQHKIHHKAKEQKKCTYIRSTGTDGLYFPPNGVVFPSTIRGSNVLHCKMAVISDTDYRYDLFDTLRDILTVDLTDPGTIRNKRKAFSQSGHPQHLNAHMIWVCRK